MTVFSRYAEYYDLMYNEKDYQEEVEFILNKLGLATTQGLSLLELGCGTGRHAAEFIDRGIDVTGVDLSPEMIEIAQKRIKQKYSEKAAEQFSVDDIRTVNIDRKFDVVVSLFHVFSYQATNADLAAAFRTAATHVKPKGKLLFDFWYGPAVLTEPPMVRVRRLKASDFSVFRIAEPKRNVNTNTVDIDYELIFEPTCADEKVAHVRETHRMRYLFLPEIQLHLEQLGMRITSSGKWMGEEELGVRSWYGWVVAEHE